jgi:hypothetical protein
MPIITLTSDYGITDHYLPALKGALLLQDEDARLVDITHMVEPGNFFEASFILRNSYHHFPKGTVHLVAFNELVANGRLLAAELDEHYFLVADNGLLPMINPDKRIKKAIAIDLRQERSLFPARDILARAAIHLTKGGSLDILGRSVEDYEQKQIARPRILNDKSAIIGSIVYIDNFGNLVSNISQKLFKEVAGDRSFEIMLPRNQRIKKLSSSYSAAQAGSLLAFFNSQGLLEVALAESRGKVFNGANSMLGVEVQNTITITFQ